MRDFSQFPSARLIEGNGGEEDTWELWSPVVTGNPATDFLHGVDLAEIAIQFAREQGSSAILGLVDGEIVRKTRDEKKFGFVEIGYRARLIRAAFAGSLN